MDSRMDSAEEKTEQELPSTGSLDEKTKQDILMCAAAVVDRWTVELEPKSSQSTNGTRSSRSEDARSSFSSPGKLNLNKKLQLRFAGVRHSGKHATASPDKQEHRQEEKCDTAGSPTKENSDTESWELSNSREELVSVLKKYQQSPSPRRSGKGKQNNYKHSASMPNGMTQRQKAATNVVFRLSRQMRYARRGGMAQPISDGNSIKLHVYDLIPAETVMQLPWGCYFPIGRCFDAVNSSLHSMGTGAYHVGIEVNGIEYSYGACDIAGHTGVFSCVPRRSPGYQYRTTIDLGKRALLRKTWVTVGQPNQSEASPVSYREVERHVDGREVIKEMATEYMGIDYDLLRKNCVTFARDAAIRLGVKDKEIPSWFRNLCESGAMTQDVALQSFEPIQSIFSACEDFGDDPILQDAYEPELEDGFEVVTDVNSAGEGHKEVVLAVDSVELASKLSQYQCSDWPLGVRRTLSWTY